jgi:hypothetical protein
LLSAATKRRERALNCVRLRAVGSVGKGREHFGVAFFQSRREDPLDFFCMGLPPGLPLCPGFHGLNSPHPCRRPPLSLFFLAIGDIRHVFACFYAILMGED